MIAGPFRTAQDTKAYLNKLVGKKADSYEITGVYVTEEKDIDGRKFWRYGLEGIPVPMTRHETWIRDDGIQYSIMGCFEHSIDQVVSNKVGGSWVNNNRMLRHTADDDRR